MSVYYRIIKFILFVIFGISIIIMIIFYFGEKLINEKAYEAKLAKIEVSQVPTYTQIPTETEAEEGSAESVQSVSPVAPTTKPVDVKSVKFSFFEKLVYFKTDLALIWGYILLALTLAIALIFPLIFMFTSFKNLIRTLGVLIGAAVLVGIAYSLASATPLQIPGYAGTDSSDPIVLKLVDTGIFLTYFLLGLALLSIFYSEIVKAFK